MHYLLGDSTESGIDFNYLAFLRDVIDVSVALVECDALLATTGDRKRIKERDTQTTIAAVEDLGRRTTAVVSPHVHDRETPVGRCANAIAVAAKSAIEAETTQIKSALATALAAIEAENTKLRKKSVEIFERLLKTHDLPNAEKVFEVAWTSAGLKAAMRQRTSSGIEAVLALDVPSSSLFGPDLRVDRIVDGIEINAVEPSTGWLKKGDKIVSHKLGRYHITRVVVVGTDVTVRVRSAGDQQNAYAFEITTDHNGENRIERLGGASTAREFSIDDASQSKVRELTDQLAAAARALGGQRANVVSVEIDGTALASHSQPRTIAERLVHAIAPTVVKIARHSRSPGELVLRRMLGDDRREEIFVSIAELQKKIDVLPPAGRELFAPLEFDRDAAPVHVPPSPSSATRPRGRTVPPPHPPPPPPRRSTPTGSLHPEKKPSDTMPLELVELSPEMSSPGMPVATAETQPTDSAHVPRESSGRLHRPTQATEPPPIRAATQRDAGTPASEAVAPPASESGAIQQPPSAATDAAAPSTSAAPSTTDDAKA